MNYVGTSGYSYKEWKGTFYPEKIAATDMLRFYAQHFKTVEINNTFYRMPNEKTLVQWSDQVSDHFAFAIKASRRITHLKRLQGVEDEMSYLLRTVVVLGPKLGPLLFQLPPNLKKDSGRLRAFLELVPNGCRAALEFRNESWFDDEVYELLSSSNVALVISDTEEGMARELDATADFAYLRLRREDYGDSDLREWGKRISDGQWNDVFAFFKHEDDGAGPRLAARLIEILKETRA
ncbi:MAG: DUF72 domain-containing protein [Gemmatimonadales bacterium]